ncbi:MAG: hypothetical protein R2830_07175 [Saprospiraceae bacterium]
MKIEYNCRVCGFYYSDPPWGMDNKTPSYEICDCCGVEFGYEDSTLNGIIRYREKWIKEGAIWFNPDCKPADWNLDDQLMHVLSKYRKTI